MNFSVIIGINRKFLFFKFYRYYLIIGEKLWVLLMTWNKFKHTRFRAWIPNICFKTKSM